MKRFSTWLILAAVILFRFMAPLPAELPPQEVERLKRIVLTRFTDKDDAKTFLQEREKAFQESVDGEAYEVFQTALNSTDVAIRIGATINLRKVKMPEGKKREMLLWMVMNPSLWPDPSTPQGGMSRNKHVAMDLDDFRTFFRETLSDVIGTKVERETIRSLWKPEMRVALAKQIGGAGAVPALGNPLDSLRVWPATAAEKRMSSHDQGVALPPNGTAPLAAVGSTGGSTPLPHGSVLWACIATALAIAAGWFLIRSKWRQA